MKIKKAIVFFFSLSLLLLFTTKVQSVQASDTNTYENSYKTVVNIGMIMLSSMPEIMMESLK